jgi:hypothetical protein
MIEPSAKLKRLLKAAQFILAERGEWHDDPKRQLYFTPEVDLTIGRFAENSHLLVHSHSPYADTTKRFQPWYCVLSYVPGNGIREYKPGAWESRLTEIAKRLKTAQKEKERKC